MDEEKFIGPTHTIFDKLDPDWCLEQAQWIVNNLPMTETSNSSGKFYHNYRCWHFFKDSEVPIVKEMVRLIQEQAKQFEEIYRRVPIPNFFVLAHTIDDSEEMCVWHKDRYFFNGQYHCTIKGNANISVDDGKEVHNINLPNGTVWYINASEYLHKINTGTGNERFELCAPMNQRPEHVDMKLKGVVNNKWRYIDGNNEDYNNFRRGIAKGVEEAVKRGTASNTSVAFPTPPEDWKNNG